MRCVLAGLALLLALGPPAAAHTISRACWPWPDSLDAVAASPQNHSVLFEDGNIRFVDVHTPPHTVNTKHDHQWLSVFLQDEAQPRGRDHCTDGTVTSGNVANGGGEVGPDAPFPLVNIAGPQAPH